LHCAHLTQLNLQVLGGTLEKPDAWDPFLEVLRERGAQHEAGYVRHLESLGLEVVSVQGVGVDDAKVSQTLQAMQAGAPIIFQGALRRDGWTGRLDILRRVATPSVLGAWSYEVVDTKLATRTKGSTILQLCLYSHLVETVQGLRPESAHVIRPWTDYSAESFRIADFEAYYRYVQESLRHAVAEGQGTATYPAPNEHCDVCQWQQRCDGERRADDHLSLVAGISKVQITELAVHEVKTATSLAGLPLPLPWKPARGSALTYERVVRQARIQLLGRTSGKMQHELLAVTPPLGLCSLPAPSHGDVFLDLEGDPFVGEGGLEYLFGYVYTDAAGASCSVSEWAVSREEEKNSFERFIDFVMDRLNTYPDLHIYHYAPYEPAALKRLMGRYATREDAMDRLLRGGRFVDLYNVVRNAVRASVESYSIKRLEVLYGFDRAVPLSDANRALFKVQACLELGNIGSIEAEERAIVSGYNRDDCRSAQRLRDWLEARRTELVYEGVDVPRPIVKPDAPTEEQTERAQRIQRLMDQLTHDVPADAANRTAEQHGRWLLAHCLDWHRQESKAGWWEYFRLAQLSSTDLLEERDGLADLSFAAENGGTKRSPIHRYSFAPQDSEIRVADKLRSVGGAPFGEVVAISADGRWVDVKKREDACDTHPDAVFSFDSVSTTTIADAVERIGAYVAKHGLEGAGQYQVARDLLLRLGPRTRAGMALRPDEGAADAAVRLVTDLRDGVLPI